MNLPPWSYTHLNDYDICPHRYVHKHVLKDVPKETTEALTKGNAVHSALEHRISRRTALPANMIALEPTMATLAALPTVDVEAKLGITAEGTQTGFFHANVWGRGKIDVYSVDVLKKVAYIGDYKTGKVREDPFELEIQALLLTARYGQLKRIIAQYIWIKETPEGYQLDKLGVPYELSDVSKTWDKISKRVSEMEHRLKMERWDKQEGPLCKWCPVKTCEFNRSEE